MLLQMEICEGFFCVVGCNNQYVFKSNYEQSSAIVTLGHFSAGPDISLTFCTTFAGLPSLENKKQQV